MAVEPQRKEDRERKTVWSETEPSWAAPEASDPRVPNRKLTNDPGYSTVGWVLGPDGHWPE